MPLRSLSDAASAPGGGQDAGRRLSASAAREAAERHAPGRAVARGARESQSSGPGFNLVVLLAGALLVVAAVGLNLIDSIFAPVFFALTLVLAGQPVQRFLVKHGWPRWLAAVVVMVLLYLILILLVLAMTLSITQLTQIVPTYSGRFQTLYLDALTWLEGLGINTAEIQGVLGQSFNVGTVMGALSSLWSAMSAFSTQLVTILLAMFFLAFDVPAISQRLDSVAQSKPDFVAALHSFSYRTRRYWVVATLFGLIVAVFDVIALQALGVPLAITWGIFAFVTNYIPNVGFVLGLIPPALMALMDQGVTTMIWVIALYSVINFIMQSLIQPKFTGDAVGLSPTVTFLSLIFWAVVVGPLGAILAVPLTLFVQSLLIDSVPSARWLNAFLGPERQDLPGQEDTEEDLGTMVVEGVRRITPRPLRPTSGARISRQATRRRSETPGERRVSRGLMARVSRAQRGAQRSTEAAAVRARRAFPRLRARRNRRDSE